MVLTIGSYKLAEFVRRFDIRLYLGLLVNGTVYSAMLLDSEVGLEECGLGELKPHLEQPTSSLLLMHRSQGRF